MQYTTKRGKFRAFDSSYVWKRQKGTGVWLVKPRGLGDKSVWAWAIEDDEPTLISLSSAYKKWREDYDAKRAQP